MELQSLGLSGRCFGMRKFNLSVQGAYGPGGTGDRTNATQNSECCRRRQSQWIVRGFLGVDVVNCSKCNLANELDTVR
jgi:hypothetical protein